MGGFALFRSTQKGGLPIALDRFKQIMAKFSI